MNNTIPTLTANARTKELLQEVARQLYRNKERYTYFDVNRGESAETLSAADDFAADLVQLFTSKLQQERIEDAAQVELERIKALLGAMGDESAYQAVTRFMQWSQKVTKQLEGAIQEDPTIKKRIQELQDQGYTVVIVG